MLQPLSQCDEPVISVGPEGRHDDAQRTTSGALDAEHDRFVTRIGQAFEAERLVHDELRRAMQMVARSAMQCAAVDPEGSSEPFGLEESDSLGHRLGDFHGRDGSSAAVHHEMSPRLGTALP